LYPGDIDWWCIDLAYQQGYPGVVQPAASLSLTVTSPSGVPVQFTVMGKNEDSGEVTEIGTYSGSTVIGAPDAAIYTWGFYIRVQSADGISFNRNAPYSITANWSY
jgi:hypothetical protein